MSHTPWLIQVAQAAITPEDLINGTIGEDQVEGLDAIREMQIKVLIAGWRRRPKLEYGYGNKIEYHVYVKRFDNKMRYLTLTAAAHGALGIWCNIRCQHEEP